MKKKFLIFILCICFIIPAMFCLSACTQTPPDIQFKVEDGYVQYYNGETWSNLIAIADLEGEDGIGVDGKEVEFRKTSTHIQWRYVDASQGANANWTNLVALSEIRGDEGTDGKEVEFRKTSTHIQWRYVDARQDADANWINLVALSEIQGDEGIDGKEVEFRKTSTHIQWRYIIANQASEEGWTNLISIEELNGEDATYSTYTITYDYGKASDLFENAKKSDTIKSTEWITTLPEIREQYKESFIGWYIVGANKQIENYDFIGGNVTLEARFNVDITSASGLYQNGRYIMTWDEIKSEYAEAFSSGENKITYYYHSSSDNGSYFTNLIGDLIIDKQITSIEYGAFEQCNGLTSVTMLSGITKIGKYAFNECSNLTNVTIPEGVQEIGTRAFRKCINLKSVEIPGTVKTIDERTFEYCENLTDVKIQEGIEIIGAYSFAWCDNLKNVSMTKSITQIGNGAFCDCEKLCTVEIFANVTSIGDSAFSGCNLSNVFVDKNNQVYDNRNDCNAIIETETNTLIVGTNNTTIPNSITMIGAGAFSGRKELLEISIPETVTKIEGNPFSGCSSLIAISVEDGNLIYNDGNNCNTIIETATNTLITGCTNTTIPNSVVKIGNSAFYGSGITNIVIENNVVEIGIAAFAYAMLKTITLPTTISEIKSASFAECKYLENIIIPSNIKTIGESAFNGCSSLSSVILEDGIERINSVAFAGTNFKSIFIPKSVTSIHYGAFNHHKLESIIVDKDNTVYDSRNNCNAIIETATNTLLIGCKNTVILEGIEIIATQAFIRQGITKIHIPSSIVTLGSLSFENCVNLKDVYIDSQAVVDLINKDNSFYSGYLIAYASNVYIKSELFVEMDKFFANNFTKQTASDKDGYDMWVKN